MRVRLFFSLVILLSVSTLACDNGNTGTSEAAERPAPEPTAIQKATAGGKMIELTKDNYNEMVIKSRGVVLVDCYTTWCKPCKILSPILEELAKEYDGKVSFGKLDCEKHKPVAMALGIQGYPTMLFYKNGKLADAVVGFIPKDDIVKKLSAMQ